MAAWFAWFIEWQIENFVEDKDGKNKKRTVKVVRQLFQEYLKKKKTTNAKTRLLARGFKTFWSAVSFITDYYFILDF